MIVPVYAAFLAVLYIILSYNVIGKRLHYKIGMGNGDNHDLAKAIRVHGNFAEYVPFALALLLMLELQGFSAETLHGLCALLCLSRCAHAWGLQRTSANSLPRSAGIIGTHTVFLCAAFLLITKYLETFGQGLN